MFVVRVMGKVYRRERTAECGRGAGLRRGATHRAARGAHFHYSCVMTKFVIALIIVGAILLSGLLALLRNWRQPMGSPDVLERARQRNREIEEQERHERDA